MDIYRIELVPDIITYITVIGGSFKALDKDTADEFARKMYANG